METSSIQPAVCTDMHATQQQEGRKVIYSTWVMLVNVRKHNAKNNGETGSTWQKGYLSVTKQLSGTQLNHFWQSKFGEDHLLKKQDFETWRSARQQQDETNDWARRLPANDKKRKQRFSKARQNQTVNTGETQPGLNSHGFSSDIPTWPSEFGGNNVRLLLP